jgi:predicted  nucleic acid-binding Zn-ribbon protein
MGATLDALHRLQEVELQIAEIQRKIDRKLRAVSKQDERIAEIDSQIQARADALKREQMEADRLDLDMKTHDASIAKLRQNLNEVKTNKEYSAVLTQLNTEKADNAKLEERVLAMLAELEAKRKAIAEIRENRAREIARRQELVAEADDVKAKSSDRLNKLMQQRAEAASAVPERALDFFNRVAKKNDGEAMALVVRTHPKRAEYACDGCNMAITIEQVNAITSRDEAVLCNICGRILYMDPSGAVRT